MTTKAEVARRQLGTALALYLSDQDPISVHCLACGGGEIAETLAVKKGVEPFSAHILQTVPDLDARSLREIRNRSWNAFKHATTKGGLERDDEQLLAAFSDRQNDHVLFLGWFDLAAAEGKMPIEAQAFQAWYFALYPEKLDKDPAEYPFDELFPGLKAPTRTEQKAALRNAINMHRDNAEIMSDPATDTRPLSF